MNIRYLVYLFPLLLFGCDNSNQKVVKPDAVFAFTPEFDSVISVSPFHTINFPFRIKVKSGDIGKNILGCSFSDLPANLTMVPATQAVGYLMSGVFTFNVSDVPIGDYPVKFNISSKVYGFQQYNILFKVVAPPDNAPKLVGNFDSSYDHCGPIDSFYYYKSTVSTIPDTPYRIKISNIRKLGTGFIVRADVSNVVRIPMQTVGGYTIYGTGTYNLDPRSYHPGQYAMIIYDTLVRGSDTEVCIAHIQH